MTFKFNEIQKELQWEKQIEELEIANIERYAESLKELGKISLVFIPVLYILNLVYEAIISFL